jgi:hypothetical protein
VQQPFLEVNVPPVVTFFTRKWPGYSGTQVARDTGVAMTDNARPAGVSCCSARGPLAVVLPAEGVEVPLLRLTDRAYRLDRPTAT